MEEAPIQVLPDELWNKIFEYLPIENIFNVSQVCRKLYEIAHTCANYKFSCPKKSITHFQEYKDYVNFAPVCNRGIRNFKNVKIWNNLPIKFIISLFHYNILGIKNIFLNYISKCSNIFSLSIVIYMNQERMTFIEDNLPKTIKSLELLEYINTEDRILVEYNSTKCPNVTNLILSHIKLKNTSNFDNLTSLHLINLMFDEITDEFKFKLSNIKKLNISNCMTEMFTNLTCFNNNEEVILSQIYINQETLLSLAKNKKLKKFTLNITLDTSFLDLSVFRYSNLEYLTINKFGKFIFNLDGLENIKYINLSGVRVSNINNTMLNKVLNLTDCNIKQHMIPKLLNVEKLNISKNYKVRDTSIFSREDCRIKILDLSYNDHIIYIDSLSNLEELSVIGCNEYIGIINILSKLNKTRLYIKPCYCTKCIKLYKYNMQKIIIEKHTITTKCIYKDKYEWFKF
jgi:hypothetical protein